MRRIIIAGFLVLSTLVCSFVNAENHGGKAAKSKKKSVLILKDTSSLEKAVSRIVADSLTKSGYRVKEASLANIDKETASSYKVSIVFSAVKPGHEIDPRVQRFIATRADTSTKILLYSVYGYIWDKQDENTDATTEATKTLHPELIAHQILRSFKR